MGRHKKGWIPPGGVPPLDPQVKTALASLPQGDGQKYYWRARGEMPGVNGLPFCDEEIPFEQMPADQIREYVDKLRLREPSLGKILVYLMDSNRSNVLDPATAQPIKVIFPAPLPIGAAAAARAGSAMMDPDLLEKKAKMDREKADLDIRKEQMRIDNEKRRVEAMERGETVDRGGQIGPDPRWPLGEGVPYKVIQIGPNAFKPVPLDEDDEEFPRRGLRGRGRDFREPRDPMETFLAIMAQQQQAAQASADRQMQLLVAMLTREDPSVKMFAAILPALTGDKMKMPELMAMIGEMRKGDVAATKHALEFHGSVMEKVADHMLEAGAPNDVIDQARRVVDLVGDGLAKGVKATLGRDSIINPDKGVPLPEETKAKAALPPAKNPPRLPAPQAPAAPAASPVEIAKAEGKRRVLAFLAFHEREMLIGSDPAAAYEDENSTHALITMTVALPASVRSAIDKGDTAEIYEAMKEFAPAEVERIFGYMADATTGAARKKWAGEFWDELDAALQGPPDDGDGAPPSGDGEARAQG